MPSEVSIEIFVPLEFHQFISAAILRLKYTSQNLQAVKTANGVRLHGFADMDTQNIEREVTYQIYREKIFQETLTMRQNLYQMLVM